jgi:DNA-binding protein H-NS
MPARNLGRMDSDALVKLRAQVDSQLAERRAEIEEQIQQLDQAVTVERIGRRRSTRGMKVPPKYRGPGGETWAGRGARPRWLVALLKQGHKLDEFAIDKLAASRKRAAARVKKRRATKTTRKRTLSKSPRRKK